MLLRPACLAVTNAFAALRLLLFLSARTVRNYLTTITTELNARNRADAVRIATEAGWI